MMLTEDPNAWHRYPMGVGAVTLFDVRVSNGGAQGSWIASVLTQ
jgi:hypothetical protein